MIILYRTLSFPWLFHTPVLLRPYRRQRHWPGSLEEADGSLLWKGGPSSSVILPIQIVSFLCYYVSLPDDKHLKPWQCKLWNSWGCFFLWIVPNVTWTLDRAWKFQLLNPKKIVHSLDSQHLICGSGCVWSVELKNTFSPTSDTIGHPIHWLVRAKTELTCLIPPSKIMFGSASFELRLTVERLPMELTTVMNRGQRFRQISTDHIPNGRPWVYPGVADV